MFSSTGDRKEGIFMRKEKYVKSSEKRSGFFSKMLAGSLCVTMRIGQNYQNVVSVCKYLSFLNSLPENLIT